MKKSRDVPAGALTDFVYSISKPYLQPKRRFDYVRWQLHQLQDARQGERLEALGQRAREYAEFASEIMQLKTELIDMLPKRRKK